MKKWLFFTASSFLAICAFVTYTLEVSCSTPFTPNANDAIKVCAPYLKYSFLLFTFAAAALFLAFIVSHDEEEHKHKK